MSGSIRFRDLRAFLIRRGGMFARNFKNPRAAEPELDVKSLASRAIAAPFILRLAQFLLCTRPIAIAQPDAYSTLK